MDAKKNYYENKQEKSNTMMELTLVLAGIVLIVSALYGVIYLIISK